jgi:hypothetical protein
MKIYIPLLLFIALTISFSSCSKDDEEESTTTPTTSGSTTTATGSISVGSESLTGSYSSSCLTTDRTGTTVASIVSGGVLPSNTKTLKYYLIVTSSSSVEFSEYWYSDASCSTSNVSMAGLWTSFSVDNASGSNYKITYTLYSSSYTPYDTTAKTFLDTAFTTTTTIGTAHTVIENTSLKNIIYVSSNSVKIGPAYLSSSSNNPSSVYDTEMTK